MLESWTCDFSQLWGQCQRLSGGWHNFTFIFKIVINTERAWHRLWKDSHTVTAWLGLVSYKHEDENQPLCDGEPMSISGDPKSNAKITYTYSVKFEVGSCARSWILSLRSLNLTCVGYWKLKTASLFLDVCVFKCAFWCTVCYKGFFPYIIRKTTTSSGHPDGTTSWFPCLTQTSSGLGEFLLLLSGPLSWA